MTYSDLMKCDNFKFQSIKKIIKKNDSISIKIISDSMQPSLNINDIINIKYININEYTFNRFDILLFWDSNFLMCHYFWSYNNLFNNNGSKSINTRSIKEIYSNGIPISPSQVIGIATNCKISTWIKFKILIKNLVKRSF